MIKQVTHNKKTLVSYLPNKHIFVTFADFKTILILIV